MVTQWSNRPGEIGVQGPLEKTVEFDGTVGAVGTVTLFKRTGRVLIHAISPFCTEALVGSTATIALGVTGDADLFIAATTAEDIDADEFWHGTTPKADGEDLPTALTGVAIEEDIIATVATANITDGTLGFSVLWEPLTPGATLVKA